MSNERDNVNFVALDLNVGALSCNWRTRVQIQLLQHFILAAGVVCEALENWLLLDSLLSNFFLSIDESS